MVLVYHFKHKTTYYSEFRKRYKYNIPMYHQPSDAMCKKFRKEHEKRTLSLYPLREVMTAFNPMVKHTLVVLGARGPDANRTLDTSGKTLNSVLTRRLKQLQ